MIYNLAKKRQCIPFCSLTPGQPQPVVSEMRLLGLVLDDKLTWWPLVRDLASRAKAKMWSLLKLREAGASEQQLLSLYIARVRSTVEYGAQVWGTVLNGSQSDLLEGVQTKSLQIILGTRSKGYERNMLFLGLNSLAERRCSLIR